jgi:hypothetical protein
MSSQESRIESSKLKALAILKFSALVTDAYFHFTPSQIMYAALALADRELVERLLQDTFHRALTSLENGSGGGKKKGEPSAAVFGADVLERVWTTIDACAEMLAQEPPERFTEFWGKVCLSGPIRFASTAYANAAPSLSLTTSSSRSTRSLRNATTRTGGTWWRCNGPRRRPPARQGTGRTGR